MKKTLTGQITQADHSPIKVGDNIEIVSQDNSGNDVVNPRRKKKRKPLDERIAEALTKSLAPVVADIKDIKNTLIDHGKRMDKQDEFNKVVVDYMKSHP